MNLSYDYTKQLLPVCYLGRQSQFLAVPQFARNQLGQGTGCICEGQSGLGYASSGVGTNQHVAGELFGQGGPASRWSTCPIAAPGRRSTT